MQSDPNPQPRWERRKDARPGDLLAAALDQFVERGFAATRLDDVAAQAGVSKGTLYLYYPSKEALFQAVVRENIVPLLDAFETELMRSETPAPEQLRGFVVDWWTHFGSTRLAGLAKLIVGESGNFPDVARFFQREVVEPNALLLARIVERGVSRGEFRQVDVQACIHIWMAPLVLKAIWQSSIEPVCPPSFNVEAGRFLDTHIDQMLTYLVPRPAADPS